MQFPIFSPSSKEKIIQLRLRFNGKKMELRALFQNQINSNAFMYILVMSDSFGSWPRFSQVFWQRLGTFSEKAVAPHFSTLAWKIPWMEEPGRLQSMGSLRVGHNWVTSLSLFPFMHWRRKWQPTPVFLPGESQGRGSLVGCHLWGRTESDTTEVT